MGRGSVGIASKLRKSSRAGHLTFDDGSVRLIAVVRDVRSLRVERRR